VHFAAATLIAASPRRFLSVVVVFVIFPFFVLFVFFVAKTLRDLRGCDFGRGFAAPGSQGYSITRRRITWFDNNSGDKEGGRGGAGDVAPARRAHAGASGAWQRRKAATKEWMRRPGEP